MRIALFLLLLGARCLGVLLTAALYLLGLALFTAFIAPLFLLTLWLFKTSGGPLAWIVGGFLFFLVVPVVIDLLQLLPLPLLPRASGSGTSRFASPRSLRRKGMM